MAEMKPALLILSSADSQALAAVLVRDGWAATGGRGFDAPVRRLEEAAARAAIVDLRMNAPAGLAAIRLLTPRAQVMAIVPGRDLRIMAEAIDAGATHYLRGDFEAGELTQAVRLIGGGARAKAATVVRDGVSATNAFGAIVAREPVSALLVAVTRFDSVNAAYGRDVGDELLAAAAQRIARAVRDVAPDMPVMRVAGAEFALLSPPAAALALAHEIVDRIERPFMIAGRLVAVGCRIGVVDSFAGEDVAALLRRASAALAEARASDDAVRAIGTDAAGAVLFDASLETDLRHAIDRREIDLLFQPQVDISTGAVVGVEALARWQHAVHGELGAPLLFAVAERSDFLGTLSQHVQKCALERAHAWGTTFGDLRLSINLTATDLARADFVEAFSALVADAGFPLDRLTVEITESGLIDSLAQAATSLAALRAKGVRVAIDDFGTGYSSLAWLKALPLDYLKIDKAMTGDIAGSTRDRVVVRSVIEMARSLGLAVIAEGVETEEQRALLAAEGCNYYQGFLFSEPLTVDALRALLERTA